MKNINPEYKYQTLKVIDQIVFSSVNLHYDHRNWTTNHYEISNAKALVCVYAIRCAHVLRTHCEHLLLTFLCFPAPKMYQFDTESSVEIARAVTSGPNQRSSDPTYILPVSNKSFYIANSIKSIIRFLLEWSCMIIAIEIWQKYNFRNKYSLIFGMFRQVKNENNSYHSSGKFSHSFTHVYTISL